MEYFPGGKQKALEGLWDQDKRSGLWSTYYENGKKKSDQEYADDKPDGVYQEWYENGIKKVEGAFKQGKKTGTWSYYEEEEQQLTKTETYANGVLMNRKLEKPKKK